MAESIRGKVIRDLIARFSNDLLIGKKIKSGELRKRAVDLEPEWKCPEQFTNTMILMENFTMELLEPVENVGSRVVLQLHGGGYIATMKNAYRSFAALYSELGGNCRVLTIDYRVRTGISGRKNCCGRRFRRWRIGIGTLPMAEKP